MVELDTQPPQQKKQKYNVGRAERHKRREAAAQAEVQQAKSLLTQLSEAHQAQAHAASLTATVSGQLTRIYTSSPFVPPAPLSVPTEKITQDDINPSLHEQEPEQQDQGSYLREDTPSDVISFGDEEEPPVQGQDTLYSLVRSTVPSPLQSPTFLPTKLDDFQFLRAGSLEQRISEKQSRSTSATSQAFQSPNYSRVSIPQGPRRQYDSYRPRDTYRPQGHNQRRH